MFDLLDRKYLTRQTIRILFHGCIWNSTKYVVVYVVLSEYNDPYIENIFVTSTKFGIVFKMIKIHKETTASLRPQHAAGVARTKLPSD